VAPQGGDLARSLLLAVLALCQLAILRRARALARGDDGERLAELGRTFAEDLKQRAGRGQGPDWLRYRGELDRLFELRDDRLRTLAAAALATGLGSTLLALLVGLLVEGFRRGQPAGPLALLASTVVCLLGSLLGVIANLIIVLSLLPGVEKRFSALAASLLAHLEEVASRHPPLVALIDALRDELGVLRQSLGAGMASAFSEAVTGWPQVVDRLSAQVTSLAAVVEAQGTSMGGAVRDLGACALAVASSSQRLQPAAAQLGEAAGLLVHLPAELRQVIASTREDWLTSLKEQQEEGIRQIVELRRQAEEGSQARERQMLAAVRELQAAVAEVQAAVGQIPGQLAAEVAEVSGKLGREFGSEARVHTQDLASHLAQEHELLLRRVAQHEQEWRNNIGTVVEELLAQVSVRIEEGVVSQLRSAGTELQRIASALPAAAAALAAAQVDWTQAQREVLAGWDEVGRRTHEAARQLAAVDGELEAGVAALAASAQHLEHIALADGDFEAKLEAALGGVTARHLASLEPFHQELMGMARGLEMRRAQLEAVLERQAALIGRYLDQLLQGRRDAVRESPA